MDTWFQEQYSERGKSVSPSFIREILKVTSSPEFISFAGGLPNPQFFPVEAFAESSARVLATEGKRALQYSVTEGDLELRSFIAERYKRLHGMEVSANEILITNGSQQALDLIAKLFIEKGDLVLLENPSYLGAIQCFSQYFPKWETVSLGAEGPDLKELSFKVDQNRPKLMYSIPNFQNPSSVCYSDSSRIELSKVLRLNKILLIEDDPYGDLDFNGTIKSPIKKYYPEGTMLLGSFSKTVAPGLRLGWVVAPEVIIQKLTILKQATDLHSNYFSQRILVDFLKHNSLDQHIMGITSFYKTQCDVMYNALEEYLPSLVKYDLPKGGMFMWLDFSGKIDVRSILGRCIEEEKVVFVPGDAFYVHPDEGRYKARLNFSNGSPEKIIAGVEKIGKVLERIV